MVTDKNTEVPVWEQWALGIFLSSATLVIVGLLAIEVYATYREFQERKLCISKGGVWTYTCHKTGDKSFELINVYE